jgi:hypothetical protein
LLLRSHRKAIKKKLTRKKKWIVITSENSITTKKQPNLGRLRSFITALKAHLKIKHEI